MLIRPLSLHDLLTVAELDRLCFPPGVAFCEEAFEECLTAPECFNLGVEKDGVLIGFAIVFFRDARSAQIITIDVHPDYRKRGLGDLLMMEIENRVAQQKLSRVVLQVSVDNLPAQTLYRKWGYVIRARLEGYYGPGLDAYVMDKFFG